MFGRNKNNYFYESFENLCEYAIKEIEVLNKGLSDFSNSTLIELKDSVHKIEHEADIKKKEIEEKLAKEFITPIDREDIFVLLDNIDDLCDAIEEISFKLYIRNYKKLPPKTMLFAEKSKEAILAVSEVLHNFEHINNKEIMDPLINKVLILEEAVDKIYEIHVHNLYLENKDYDEIRLGERVYSYFEYVTDKCRDICKTILIIMYKNL